jgi:endonuclease/exonuclease/phosphatase family metal-dependent hydrolase
MKRKIANLLFLMAVSGLLIGTLAANASGGQLKLLTINLLFSKPTTSLSSDVIPRFKSIADYIVTEDIDCVLCQEVVGGELAKKLGLTQTLNSSLDLKNLLGKDYELSYHLANGIPLVFSVGNAIFCKKPIDIKWTVADTLPFASEVTINGTDIKLRRVIMSSLLEAPGFGRLLLFNVHLCSGCPTEQRRAQIEEALEFIGKVKKWARLLYGNVPCLFGGDFNISDKAGGSADSLQEYELITNAGFQDAYADYGSCTFGTDCCEPDDDPSIVEDGCTYAVDNNLFENDPLQTTRIDYFFYQGLSVDSASVVFNSLSGPFVSDHSGLLVEMSPQN